MELVLTGNAAAIGVSVKKFSNLRFFATKLPLWLVLGVLEGDASNLLFPLFVVDLRSSMRSSSLSLLSLLLWDDRGAKLFWGSTWFNVKASLVGLAPTAGLRSKPRRILLQMSGGK